MSAPELLPKFVYKILDSEPTAPLAKALPLSELDAADGFIHLSTASQVPMTASLFFASHTYLWLLKVRFEDIASASKWEHPPNSTSSFPHLYGNFGAAETESVQRFERSAGGEQDWKEVFAASTWLE